MVIGPEEVSTTTIGLPGAGCSGAAGAAAWRSKPSSAKKMDIKVDRRRTPAGSEHRLSGRDAAPKTSCATIQANGSSMLGVTGAARQSRVGYNWCSSPEGNNGNATPERT